MEDLAEYIHELSDWPRFTWGNSVYPMLLRVARQQGLLQGQLQAFGFDIDANAATLTVLTEDVIKTSAIEGETLNEEQVRSSIARHLGIDIGLDVPADRAVEGIVDVLLDATKNSAEALTAERLFGWHSALFPNGHSGINKIVVGRWRTGEMAVVSGKYGKERVHFAAPAPERLDQEMNLFLDWFNAPNDDMVDPVLKSAVAHLWFVTIHPFDDGNGRIARALTDMLLARADKLPGRFYSLSSQIAKERLNYYHALEGTQGAEKNGMDITQWIEWFLGCLLRSMAHSEPVFHMVMHKMRLWRRLSDMEVNERQREMLERLFGNFVGKLTADKWAKMTKVSKPTAVRDINELLKYQVLVSEAAGRGTHYRLAD